MTEYLVVYESDGATWSAYLPDIPGCVAAAPTREQTEAEIRTALQMHLDGLREVGSPIPSPTTVGGTVAA